MENALVRTRLCVHGPEIYRNVHASINWQKRFIETADVFSEFVYFSKIKGQT